MHTLAIIAAIVYGTINAQSNLVVAPYAVKCDGAIRVTASLAEDRANALGYRLVVDTPPKCASNEYAVAIGYVISGEPSRIVRIYERMIQPTVPRKFSRLKLYGAIAQLGAWPQIQSWLEAKTIGGVNGWMAFQLAQEVSEDHPMFAPLANEAKALLGLSDEQFESLLNACVLEE